MPPFPAPAPRGLSRRAFLASTGLVLLTAGCTGDPTGSDTAVGAEEADRMADQMAVQEAVVAAYAAAGAADAALGGQVAVLAGQAGTQLDRLRAAAPSAGSPSASSSALGPAPGEGPPPGSDVRAWLRERVAAAAAAHAEACIDQSGARAALLGAVAAGLRGQEAALA